MNRYNAIGRLTKDVEDRVLQNGTPAAIFDLAVNSNYADKEGNFKTNFIRCKAFGNIVNVLTKYTHKGSKIGIEGEIQTGSYDTQDGTKKYTTDILISKLELLDSKPNNEQVEQKEITPSQPQGSVNDPYKEFATEHSEDFMQLSESDLPF